MTLPKFDKHKEIEGNYSINQARDMVGKTIESVELGFAASNSKLHQRELLIISFTDGTKLAISIGSNVQNVIGNLNRNGKPNLKPNDFHTDLDLFWQR
ncbi:hypothetical protein ACLEC1_02455 [Lonsdalea quercina]|uniref:hypothetical protein n=1 Tax=Lonsdalea quercina TaxID=71657 RepID=UPI0039756DCB